MIPDIATCPLLGRGEGGGTPPVENHMSLRIQQVPKEVREETNPRDTVRTKAIRAVDHTERQASGQAQVRLEGCGALAGNARRGQSQGWRSRERSDGCKASKEK